MKQEQLTMDTTNKPAPSLTNAENEKKAGRTEKPVSDMEKLYKACDEMKGELATLGTNEVRSKFKVAGRIKTFFDAESKYGTDLAGTIAERVGLTTDAVYEYRIVAGSFSQEAIVELIKSCNEHGRVATWTAIVKIARIPSIALREKICAEFKEEPTTIEQLKGRIAEASKADRRVIPISAKPRSAEKTVVKMRAYLDQCATLLAEAEPSLANKGDKPQSVMEGLEQINKLVDDIHARLMRIAGR